MKTVRTFCGLVAMSWALAPSSAWAQRVQFATPLASQSAPATSGAPALTSPPAATYAQPAAPALSPTPYPAPSLTPSASPLGSPGATLGAPTMQPLSPTYAPSAAAGSAPAAAFNGGVQPPAATWDPYATPGNTPSALLPQDPYFQSGGPAVSMAAVQKFVQHIDLNYHWFAGHNGDTNQNQLGINDVELSVTFAFPLFHNSQTPLLVTPGFAVHYWEGPVSVLPLTPSDPPTADLPPRTYDAYLDFAWNPQITEFFGAELNFRTGIYSDFSRVTADSMRYMGKGMGVLKLSPSMTLKAGVWYLDRLRVKLLPAGGLVWTPNADIYFNILFPNPKVAKRLTTWGNTEWWLYGSGNYGGGDWTIKRDSGFPPGVVPTDGTYDRFDYNDIEIALGLEFKTVRQLNGYFEVGLSCSREVVYQSGSPSAFYPDNTVYLGAGLAY